MKTTEKLDQWIQDTKFMAFVDKRVREEFFKPANNLIDPQYEEVAEGFDDDDDYIVPMVDYLSFRLHRAQLIKNRRKREREIWWLWTQLECESYYLEVFRDFYAKLLDEVMTEVMTILHREYEQQNKMQTSTKQ